jgi:leucyl aminopeptidase
MEITFEYRAQSINKARTECLIVFFPKEKEKSADIMRELNQLPAPTRSTIRQLLDLGDFSGKIGETQLLISSSAGIPRILLVGLGPKAEIDQERLRRAGGKVGKKLLELKLSKLSLQLPSFLKKTLKFFAGTAFAEGLALGCYEFKAYKSQDQQEKQVKAAKVTIYDPLKNSSKKAVQAGQIRAEATNFARTLGNIPPNDLTPTAMVKQAQEVAQEHNLAITVLEEEDMAKLGMRMLLGVSKGSSEPAKLIILEYQRKNARDTIAFVGKGITFDSGGISLKPGKNMDEMKFDMCGAAAVLGAMKAVGSLQPNFNVIGVVPTSENLPGGQAQRPGDIVKSYAGNQVEILNTDAEGRLILGDALTYAARKFKPSAMIDLATLTGACVVALGSYASGAISNDEALCQKVVAAGKSSGDRIWPLPNFSEYEEAIKGKYGDLQNIGGPAAGVITAGLFLKNFVEKTPWVHLDIAGTAWNVKGIDYLPNSGATGVGVRLLIDFVNNWKT